MGTQEKKIKTRKFWLFDFIKSWTQYQKFKNLNPDQRNIVFYSESGQDWHHLKPLIIYLTLKSSRVVCYITSDSNDKGLYQDSKNFLSFYIKEGFWQISLFQFLKADVMVLTMTDLNIFQLKRSINPVHYIYIFHALGSTHMVDFENSYDHYDTIFCVGQHQRDEIRKREKIKGLPRKNLFNHGYSRLETIIKENSSYKYNKNVKGVPKILLAPTWGDNSILNICGEKLVDSLINAGYKVILRPHYQTLKLTPEVVNTILNKFKGHPQLEYVNLMGDMDSLFQSDLLICDWSSTSIEYALGLQKPVLYINIPRRVRNSNYHELGIEPMEVYIRDKVGAILDPTEIDKAPDIIKKLLKNQESLSKKIAELRKRIVFNLGSSVEIGAKEIARIADLKSDERRGIQGK